MYYPHSTCDASSSLHRRSKVASIRRSGLLPPRLLVIPIEVVYVIKFELIICRLVVTQAQSNRMRRVESCYHYPITLRAPSASPPYFAMRDFDNELIDS